MAAILDFTGEAAMPISETAFPATGNIIDATIVKITPIEADIMTISAVLDILATNLDSGDRIAKPTSIMVLQHLIIHKKWY